jgi:hypothetical protein
VDDTQTRIDRDLDSPEARNCGPAGSEPRYGGIHPVRRDSVCSTDSVCCPVVAGEEAELDRTRAKAEDPRTGDRAGQRRSLRVHRRTKGDDETGQTEEQSWTTAADRHARGQTAAQLGVGNSTAASLAGARALRAHIDLRLAGRGSPTCPSLGRKSCSLLSAVVCSAASRHGIDAVLMSEQKDKAWSKLKLHILGGGHQKIHAVLLIGRNWSMFKVLFSKRSRRKW